MAKMAKLPTVEEKLELFKLMVAVVNDVVPEEDKEQLKYNKFEDDDWHEALEIGLYRKDVINDAPYYKVMCSDLCYIEGKDSFELPYGYITVYKVRDGEEDSRYGSHDDVYCISVDDARKKYKENE